jgi:hypothetical protein
VPILHVKTYPTIEETLVCPLLFRVKKIRSGVIWVMANAV